jgi:hypothetical protein
MLCRDIYSAVTFVAEAIRLNYDCPRSSGVVPRIAFARHADADAVFFEQVCVVAAGVLRPAVRMVNQAGLHAAPRYGHSQRSQRSRSAPSALRRDSQQSSLPHDSDVASTAKAIYRLGRQRVVVRYTFIVGELQIDCSRSCLALEELVLPSIE